MDEEMLILNLDIEILKKQENDKEEKDKLNLDMIILKMHHSKLNKMDKIKDDEIVEIQNKKQNVNEL